MRVLSISLFASILLLFAPLPTAAADETFGCHSWEVFVGDREQGVGVSTEDGATFVGAGGFYVVNDGAPLLNDWIFSIWIYQEGNGEPGLQRVSETCDESSPGNEGDTGCFC